MIALGDYLLVPAPETRPTVTMGGRVFGLITGDTCYYDLHQTVSKTVIYSDLLSGKNYQVEAIAWVSGGLIVRALYINGKQISLVNFNYNYRNNGLFNNCSAPKFAISWGLEHAESLVKHMAFNDSIVK